MPVIIFTAPRHGGRMPCRRLQLGAYDFITKPLDIDPCPRLPSLARSVTWKLQREVEVFTGSRGSETALSKKTSLNPTKGLKPQLIGCSPAWIEVFKNIGRVAATDVGRIAVGENRGTGKEVVCPGDPSKIVQGVVAPSSSSIARHCLLSCWSPKLFGHERGAFTGAVAQKRGKFEAADGGNDLPG